MLLETLHGVALVALDVKAKASVKAQVADKVEKCQCLLCEAEADRRGLCKYHYSQFRTVLHETALQDRPALEARFIRNGELLPSRQGQRFDIINPYRESARR